jgi:N-acetylmuramic acid 6-phosphate etherase
MKAGTAQRVALNLLSSLVMIRLGRVHEGLMVDLQAINAKLARRSENILTRLTGRTPVEVRAALEHAHGSVKLAVLLLHGYGLDEATRALAQADGRLRTALKHLGRHAGAADILTIDEELSSDVQDRG